MNTTTETKRPLGTRWCSIGSWLAGIGLLGAALGLLGAQSNILGPLSSFMAFGIGALLCLVALLVLLIGLILSKGSAGAVAPGRAWGAFVAAGLLIGLSLTLRPDASGAPPIHDISTDLDNPPAFSETMIAARAADGAKNPPEYAGEEFARQQREAFPDLDTLTLSVPPADAFKAAADAARELGWVIVTSDAQNGRLEATDITSWFRFRDDVVIRITSGGDETYVDVRSKSRVGMGDMGANEARISAFLDRLSAATQR